MAIPTKVAGNSYRASQINQLRDQSFQTFANTTARDAFITAPSEGQPAHTTDDDTTWIYRAGAWVILSEPTQSWTPTVTQSGAVSKTVTWGYYIRTGGIFFGSCRLDFTGSGTATNEIVVTGPLTHVVAGGTINFYDTSGGYWRQGGAVNKTTSTFNFTIDEGTDYYGKAGGDGITSGDVMILTIMGIY